MWFGSVSVSQNCDWRYDVEYDGVLEREICDISELNVFEEMSLIRDEAMFWVSNFPWNMAWSVIEKINNTPFCRRMRDKIDEINGM